MKVLLFITIILLPTKNETECNVFSYDVSLEKGAWSIEYSNKECYTAKIRTKRTRSQYIVYFDGVAYSYTVVKDKVDRFNRRHMIATHNKQVYYIIEFPEQEKLRIAIKPTRFNNRFNVSARAFVISSDQVCDRF